MDQQTTAATRPRAWIVIVGIIILLIFLYFYQPFENYLIDGIQNIHAYNIIFWFTSLVGIVGYAFDLHPSSEGRLLDGWVGGEPIETR